jgi:hypothetical protein
MTNLLWVVRSAPLELDWERGRSVAALIAPLTKEV